MKLKKICIIYSIVMFVGMGNLSAQITENVAIHGFGGWGYGITDGNHYLVGNDEGDYDHNQFSLNMRAVPYQKLAINTQFLWKTAHEVKNVELEYAFAEWTFSHLLKFRLGKVKQPFGIFSEVYEVGTIRPFFSLPQAVYGPVGIAVKSYSGLGITGIYFTRNDWGISYDLYGGMIELEDLHVWHILAIDDVEAEHTHINEVTTKQSKDFIGGRLNFLTPITGLSFGFSAFTGRPAHAHRITAEDDQEIHDDEQLPFGDHLSYGIHFEYFIDELWLRAEYAVHDHKDVVRANGWYCEIAYKLTEHWQTAVHYDRLDSKLPNFDVSEAPSLIEHEDFAVGLNYWFNSNFVLKIEYHMVNGNRFALPEHLYEAIEEGTLDKKTNLIQLGGHFSF